MRLILNPSEHLRPSPGGRTRSARGRKTPPNSPNSPDFPDFPENGPCLPGGGRRRKRKTHPNFPNLPDFPETLWRPDCVGAAAIGPLIRYVSPFNVRSPIINL